MSLQILNITYHQPQEYMACEPCYFNTGKLLNTKMGALLALILSFSGFCFFVLMQSGRNTMQYIIDKIVISLQKINYFNMCDSDKRVVHIKEIIRSALS